MLREDIYRSIVIFCGVLLTMLLLISLNSDIASLLFEMLIGSLSLLLVISIFLWKPNSITAIGAVVFAVDFNIKVYLKFFENGQQKYEIVMALVHSNFYMWIASILIIHYGFYKNSKLKQLKLEHLHPILSVTILIIISFVMQYVLRLL